MKTSISLFFLVLFMAPVVYSSPNFNNPKSEITIPENETKGFTDDPVAYIIKNFDLKNHPSFIGSDKDSEFLVTFKCAKGRLLAKYDGRGNLLSTSHKFKNVSVPRDIMAEIYRDYKGWEVKDIEYRANGRGEAVKTARYKILLQKGDQEKVFIKKLRSQKEVAQT